MIPNDEQLQAMVASLIEAVQINQTSRATFERQPRQAVDIEFPGEVKYAVDSYEGPKGQGFQICFCYELEGEKWRCVFNHGPEASRTRAWIKEPKPNLCHLS